MVGAPVLVGLAEVQAISGAAMLTCLGLGSCVSVCVLDPVANVSGMAHIMLPTAFSETECNRPGTFADTGVAELIHSMEKLGGERLRMQCAVAGGASIRTSEHGQENRRCCCRSVEHLRFEVHGTRLRRQFRSDGHYGHRKRKGHCEHD